MCCGLAADTFVFDTVADYRFSSCVAFAENWGVADAIDYETQIQPIFKRYCVSCHGESGGESDVSLASLKSIQSGYPKGALVVPGDPDGSKILQLMLGQEPKMPLKMSLSQLQKKSNWFVSGSSRVRQANQRNRLL